MSGRRTSLGRRRFLAFISALLGSILAGWIPRLPGRGGDGGREAMFYRRLDGKQG